MTTSKGRGQRAEGKGEGRGRREEEGKREKGKGKRKGKGRRERDNARGTQGNMKKRMTIVRTFLTFALCPLPFWAAPLAHAQPQPTPMLRVFLDCHECDTEYQRQNVTFVDYVRDRAVADLHVLVTTQGTGGGGASWTVKFIGLGPFSEAGSHLHVHDRSGGNQRRPPQGLRADLQDRPGGLRRGHGDRAAARRRLDEAGGDESGSGSLELLGLPRESQRQLRRRALQQVVVVASLLLERPHHGQLEDQRHARRQSQEKHVRGRRRSHRPQPARRLERQRPGRQEPRTTRVVRTARLDGARQLRQHRTCRPARAGGRVRLLPVPPNRTAAASRCSTRSARRATATGT